MILRCLLLLITAQTLLWTVSPALLFNAPPLDVVENIVWSREWQLGYYKHPPLQAWLTGFALKLSGNAIWSIYLLAQICVTITFLGLFLLGRDLYGAETGLKAALLFAVVYYATVPSPEFNANILQMPIWSLSGWLLWRCMHRPGFVYPLGLAVALALALHAKYSIIFLLATLLLAVLSQRQGRTWLKSPAPWLAGLVCIGLCLPHLQWLVESDYLPIRYAMERSKTLEGWAYLGEPVGFLAAQALDHIVPIIIVLLWGTKASRTMAISPETRYLRILAFGPLSAMVAYSLVNGTALRDMWGAPAVVWISLFFAHHTPSLRDMRHPRTIKTVWLLFFLATPLIYPTILAMTPQISDKPHKTTWPGAALTDAIHLEWQKHVDHAPGIIGGPTWEAGLIATYLSPEASGLFRADIGLNPWITAQRIAKEGVLFVWSHDHQRPTGHEPFAHEGDVTITHQSYDYTMKWAILRPSGVE